MSRAVKGCPPTSRTSPTIGAACCACASVADDRRPRPRPRPRQTVASVDAAVDADTIGDDGAPNCDGAGDCSSRAAFSSGASAAAEGPGWAIVDEDVAEDPLVAHVCRCRFDWAYLRRRPEQTLVRGFWLVNISDGIHQDAVNEDSCSCTTDDAHNDMGKDFCKIDCSWCNDVVNLCDLSQSQRV